MPMQSKPLTTWDFYQKLKPALPARTTLVTAAEGKTYVTTKAAFSKSEFYVDVTGRLVGGDRPNLNNALWLREDLEHGLATVAGGPINVLHDQWTVCGTLTHAEMASMPDGQAYIHVNGKIWRWLYPWLVDEVERLAAAETAWFSMECVADRAVCTYCQRDIDYRYLTDEAVACKHMLTRSHPFRLVRPTFLGAAVIIPPDSPGWPDADLRVVESAVLRFASR